MSNESIKRVGDFKYEPDDFKGVRAQTLRADIKLTKNAPTDSAYLWRHGLVVRYSTGKAALVTPGTVAAAAIEMARDIPAMRQALLVALTAMDADTTTSEPTQVQFTAFDPTDPTLGGWSR